MSIIMTCDLIFGTGDRDLSLGSHKTSFSYRPMSITQVWLL